MSSVYAVSQDVTYSYTSNFAKLQHGLEEKFGSKSMRTINFSELDKYSEPYSLQIIGTSNYKSFLEKDKIYDIVRILYLNNIDFRLINNYVFDKLKNLKAVVINNCRNIETVNSTLSE